MAVHGPRSLKAVPSLLAVAALVVVAATLNAQKQRNTDLFLDSAPADSVHCAGLTVQFARFFLDEGKHPLVGENIEGSHKNSIDIWIWNRTDSARTYDPKMFKAINDQANQINFWSADEIADWVSSHITADNPEAHERAKYRTRSRLEYQGGPILPGASGGPKILVPDNDKHLDKGITLYCGVTKLGLLHKK